VIQQNKTEQASAIQSSLKKAGINVRIQVLDSEVYSDTVTNNQGNYDLTIASWQPDFPDAYANLAPLFSSSMIGNGNQNMSRYSNRAVDALMTQATQTVDQKTAGKLWAQADQRIMHDVPVVPLIYSHNTFIHGSRVTGFDIGNFPAYPDYLTMGLTRN
jgi:peptide/nickel transport system substrate-binding protein